MAHRVRANLARDLDLPLRDERARDGRSEKILALVHRVRAKHREDVIAHELLAEVVDVNLLDANLLRLGARGLELLLVRGATRVKTTTTWRIAIGESTNV